MIMEIKQRVHDGQIFFWTTQAVKSESGIIGVYFDMRGIPQSIYRHSMYGDYIIEWER